MYRYIALVASFLALTSCTTPSTNQEKNLTGSTTSGSTVTAARIPSPTYGTGKHTLVAYADFQCPACITSAKTVMPTFEKYAEAGYLTITYKQYPLTNIHKNAERDALAALCVASQSNGIYPAYKAALYAMEEKKSGAKTSDGDRVDAARNIPAIDVSALTECLDNDTYLDQVHAEMKEGDAKNVTGTPTLFLDDKKLDLGIFRDTTVLTSVLNRILEVPATATGFAIPAPTPTVSASGTQK